MLRRLAVPCIVLVSACGGSPGADDASVAEPDAAFTDEQLACTPRIERDVPEHFRGSDYVPAVSVEGTVTAGGRTWQIASASLEMQHVRDPDASDRCVVEYSVLAFLDRDAPTCVLALRFYNHNLERNLYEFAFDTTGCEGVPADTETLWESPFPVAPRWPTLTGSLLAEDDHERCAPATISFPDVNLPIPAPAGITVAVKGFRIAGPFASQTADWTASCDVPIAADCSTGDPGPDGVCAPY